MSLAALQSENIDSGTAAGRMAPAVAPSCSGREARTASMSAGNGGSTAASATISTDLDRLLRATFMRATLGRSPLSLFNASVDWLGHFAMSPGLQQELAMDALERAGQFWSYAVNCATAGDAPPEPCVQPAPHDKRFADAAWSQWPFNLIHQSFLLQQEWWERAIISVPGVAPHNVRKLAFAARQALDPLAPSNFIATNPVVLRRIAETGGENLLHGARNLADDLQRLISGQRPAGAEAYRVGETIACTPGMVVFRNELIEVIQYAPQTETVHAEPVLIVPAWIMKYYILDLSPDNSLVRHLVEAGHTVFIVSWRNPRPEHREIGLDDYLSRGIGAALRVVQTLVPGHPVHAVGYCLGGTLLSIAAAALGRSNDPALKSLTLLAAQTDFADAGELTLFVDESEVTFLEDLMWQKGILEARQMAGAFHLLRSNDLIWSRMVRDYLIGRRTKFSDLMAWNADATHMSYRMHSEYLRRLFLNNDLAAGRYVVDGLPVGLSNIKVPIFAVASEWDHVAPWTSVYKVHLQADVDVTFVLTTGGHNAGIVNPPGPAQREFRIGTHSEAEPYLSPERWRNRHNPVQGSWWPAWLAWLSEHSTERIRPPQMGMPECGIAPVKPAPGDYVFDR